MDNENRIKELEDKVKRMEEILFGINNDTRFVAKVRSQVIDGVTSAGLPIIVDKKGTKWSITNVTKLN